jgi:hypothetical protein
MNLMKLAVTFLAGLALLRAGAGELATFDTNRFSGAGNCAFCHDPFNPSRAGRPDEAAVLATDWRATMMANSFKDPLWRAVMEAEVTEHPALKSFIENKCLTCHAPMARHQAAVDGTNELSFADALRSPLAGEGVGCTLCHQIQPGNLGSPGSFTGGFQIGANREIFGPYDDVLTMPMQRHVNYTPKLGRHTQDSSLCATCHTLFTPVLDEAGAVRGQFPEQVPFLEWRQSEFARRGRHCQDCHMEREDKPVKVSARPPWLEPRAPFWKHQFVGGNVFMLRMLSDDAGRLDANASPAQFEVMIEEAREQLRRAAELEVSALRDEGTLTLRVKVQNLAGHKFPTGHPYRRAWLHVRVADAKRRLIFESGSTDKTGSIRGVPDGFTPHRDLITRPEEVQIYQSVMRDASGHATWSLLRGAAYLKDNRIPPRGFTATGPDAEAIAVRGGAETDANFNAGSGGGDEVTYRITLASPPGRITAEVELLYQSISPESVARLLKARTPSAVTFAKLYRSAGRKPELVASKRLEL